MSFGDIREKFTKEMKQKLRHFLCKELPFRRFRIKDYFLVPYHYCKGDYVNIAKKEICFRDI